MWVQSGNPRLGFICTLKGMSDSRDVGDLDQANPQTNLFGCGLSSVSQWIATIAGHAGDGNGAGRPMVSAAPTRCPALDGRLYEDGAPSFQTIWRAEPSHEGRQAAWVTHQGKWAGPHYCEV